MGSQGWEQQGYCYWYWFNNTWLFSQGCWLKARRGHSWHSGVSNQGKYKNELQETEQELESAGLISSTNLYTAFKMIASDFCFYTESFHSSWTVDLLEALIGMEERQF